VTTSKRLKPGQPLAQVLARLNETKSFEKYTSHDLQMNGCTDGLAAMLLREKPGLEESTRERYYTIQNYLIPQISPNLS